MDVAKNKIILVDDHALFRGGLRGLLISRGFDVIGEAATGEEFLELPFASQADIVLLDIAMPGIGGAAAAKIAIERDPELKIITLSMHGDEDYYFSMISAGVKGFLLKNTEIDELLRAIETVSEGGTYFSQELLQNVVGSLRASSTVAPLHQELLSVRELEILPLICQGLSNQEIAEKLFISKRTVDKHRANILAKTGCRNTANLVAFAIKNSLVEL